MTQSEPTDLMPDEIFTNRENTSRTEGRFMYGERAKNLGKNAICYVRKDRTPPKVDVAGGEAIEAITQALTDFMLGEEISGRSAIRNAGFKVGALASHEDMRKRLMASDLGKHIAALSRPAESKQGWMTIDSAPKTERKPIWIWGPNYRQPMAANSDMFWRCGYSVENTPTHWMPREVVEIPAAPTSEDSK